jgi:mannonate dehydratase
MNTRRSFLAAASAAAAPVALAAKKSARRPDIKLGLQGSTSEEILRFCKQIGVEWIATPLRASQGQAVSEALTRGAIVTGADGSMGGIGAGPGGPSGPWKEEEVRSLIQRVEAAGLRLGNVMLHPFTNALLGNSERDRDIENVRKSIRIAGRLGVPVVEYNFYALRNVEGLDRRPGRGGATYRGFDDTRVKDRSPLPAIGTVSDEQMWERLRYFLKAVVPAAQESHVRLALHPNDPPVPNYRGVAQAVDTVEHWKRLVNFIPSPANGITLDTGVTAEQGADVVETIRYFGQRDCINHVHFRNVRTLTPKYNYIETFIDEGQTDMLAAMRALREAGYSQMVVPDHSPSITGDTNAFGAWGYALGYIKALIRATD